METVFKVSVRVDSLTSFVRGGNTRFVLKGVDLDSGECLALMIPVENIGTEEAACVLAAEAWPHRFNLQLGFKLIDDGEFTHRLYSEFLVTDL